MNKEFGTQGLLLVIFLICVGWAGSILAYTVNNQDETFQTAEVQLDSQEAGRFFNRDRNEPKRSTPYKEQETPQFETPPLPVPEGFKFPEPAGPEPTLEDIIGPSPVPAPLPAPPVLQGTITDETPTDDNPISAALGSLTKLFNGEADFSDIIKLAIAAFTIFGGAQFGSSDILFKVILGLFSKKTNFHDILKEQVDIGTNRRLLDRLKSKK